MTESGSEETFYSLEEHCVHESPISILIIEACPADRQYVISEAMAKWVRSLFNKDQYELFPYPEGVNDLTAQSPLSLWPIPLHLVS